MKVSILLKARVKMRKAIINQSGQALVTLLFLAVMGMTIALAAAVFIFQNMQASSNVQQGIYAYYIAESGIEEGILRMLRNPGYTGTLPGQPLFINGGNVSISTSSGGILTAVGTYQSSVRKIQIKTVYNNGVLTIQSWKEVN